MCTHHDKVLLDSAVRGLAREEEDELEEVTECPIRVEVQEREIVLTGRIFFALLTCDRGYAGRVHG